MKQNWWTAFLGSLATPGGSVFVLLVALSVLTPIVAFCMVKFGPSAPVVINLNGMLAGFAGALIAVVNPMGNRSNNQRSTDSNGTNGATIPPTQT